MRNIIVRSAFILAFALSLSACGEAEDTEPTAGSEEPVATEPAAEDGTPESPIEQPQDGEETNPSAESDPELDNEEPEEGQLQNLAELLEGDPRFSDVVDLVNILGLLDVMRSPGPFTLFIPTNDAVDALPGDLMTRVREEQEFLHKFILTHVAEGDLPSADLVDGESVQMIGGPVQVGLASDGIVTLGGAPVLEADIPASNGRLHVLSAVIPIPTAEPTE